MTITPQTAAPAVPRITPGDRLGLTVFLAAVIHAIIILGVGFGANLNARDNLPSLDVVLMQNASRQAPKKADYLASANQQASGSADVKLIPTSPVLGPAPLSTLGLSPIPVRAAPAAQPQNLRRMLLTDARATLRAPDQQERQPQEALDTGGSRAQVDLELARLTAELSQDVQRYAKRPRVNYLDSVSAKTAVEAAYVKAWVDRVERIGNLNYPDYARRRELNGKLIVHVLLASDGNIVSAFIGAPSGQQVLDDAALRIVKLAAPFKPFSPPMHKVYDQLMITRTWIFESEGELTTQ